jgi:hypothetical protein
VYVNLAEKKWIRLSTDQEINGDVCEDGTNHGKTYIEKYKDRPQRLNHLFIVAMFKAI